MNRAEKIALLTKVLQQGDSPATRQRLQRVSENMPRSLIIIDDFGIPEGQTIADSDPVHFHDRGQRHDMTLGEAYEYARVNRIGAGTIFILPAKREL